MTSEIGQAGKRLREKKMVKGGIVDSGVFLTNLEMMWELLFTPITGGRVLGTCCKEKTRM